MPNEVRLFRILLLKGERGSGVDAVCEVSEGCMGWLIRRLNILKSVNTRVNTRTTRKNY